MELKTRPSLASGVSPPGSPSNRRQVSERLWGQPPWHPGQRLRPWCGQHSSGASTIHAASLLPHVTGSVINPHAQMRTQGQRDPSQEGAEPGFGPRCFSNPVPPSREGVQAGPAGQAGAQRAGSWAGASPHREVLRRALRSFLRGHMAATEALQLPGLLFRLTDRKHCPPVPQMALPCHSPALLRRC